MSGDEAFESIEDKMDFALQIFEQRDESRYEMAELQWQEAIKLYEQHFMATSTNHLL